MNKDKNTLKEFIMVLKNDYKTPGKFLIWGLASCGTMVCNPFRFIRVSS
jgi:hypothetical protein